MPALTTKFPNDLLRELDRMHYPGIRGDLAREALNPRGAWVEEDAGDQRAFGLLKLLMIEDLPVVALRSKAPHLVIPPLHGALLKHEQDVHLFERLAFLHGRGG